LSIFLGDFSDAGALFKILAEARRLSEADVAVACFMSSLSEGSRRSPLKNTYSQTSRLEIPEDLQQKHDHGHFLFLTVPLLCAQLESPHC
jgi:heme oxygenase